MSSANAGSAGPNAGPAGSNAGAKLLRRRAEIVRQVRAFFEQRDFLEVDTPLLIPSPGLDLHLQAFQVGGRYLSTSPEYQMKRLLADGYARIFQITRAFRQGELGSRHNPEFTILEFYRANAGVPEVMRDTEELVEAVTGGEVRLGARRIATRAPFARMTLCEAYERFAKIAPDETLAMATSDEDRFFRVLVDEVEPRIAELDHALFLTEYPAPQASLARKKPADPRVAERFELYVAGVELCNGFGELTDPVEQRARFEQDQRDRRERGLPVYPIDERFLQALERGMPDSGGNAVGLDRLIAVASGTTAIREVMAFADDEL
ncbi:EF-P lysine aminoacylase EpmA [Pendulispora albinea]|uniref:EF-P lysine aminoacylase GenX n=1 Tax=Pendulispora albinea TaxID=2741071 RepID=A0ABZ2M259_9BACT